MHPPGMNRTAELLTFSRVVFYVRFQRKLENKSIALRSVLAVHALAKGTSTVHLETAYADVIVLLLLRGCHMTQTSCC